MKSHTPGDQCGGEFISDTPHFFKIILDDTDLQKLRIPNKFARNYGSEISSSVFLKVPIGASWKVKLTKFDDGTWLHNGWSEFAKYYSLNYGSLLFFRYEGHCNFHVIIFDKSATEISYPFRGNHGSRVPNGRGFQDHAMEDNRDDISVEILDDIQPSKKTRARSPSPSSRPRKKINSTSKDDILVGILDDIPPPSKKKSVRSPSSRSQPCKTLKSTSNINNRHSSINPSANGNGKRSQQMEACRRKAKLARTKRAKALLPASSFKSKYPFFGAVMQPSYVHDRCLLCLPTRFCKRYLPKHSGDAILSVSHKKEMHVGFCLSARPKIHRGWKEFVKENHLEVGDVCVFELINHTKMTFNVEIFRKVQDAETGPIPAMEDNISVEILDDIQPLKKTRVRSTSPSSRPSKKINSTSEDDKSTSNINIRQSSINPSANGNGKRSQQMEACSRKAKLLRTERAKALLPANSFKSKYPFFRVVMQPSYVRDSCLLSLPANFCEKYLPKHGGEAILSVSRRNEMSVGFSFSLSTRPKFHRGWKEFVKENRLEVGDVCAFELINHTKITFNVEIFRNAQDAETVPIPAKDGPQEKSTKHTSRPTRTASASQRFASFKSENPFVLITIPPSCIYQLTLPYLFVVKHIKQDVVNLTLENGDKRWPVQVLQYPENQAAALSGGWRAFARENAVKTGDMCALELINKEDAVLRVIFFKN